MLLSHRILFCFLNFVATNIELNRVILAGETAYLICYSSYAPLYWHFCSLTSDSQPCGFGSYDLHDGIFRCPSVSRISVEYSNSSEWQSIAHLRISEAKLSDAGTYTCGGQNPYNYSMTTSAVLGVISKCALWLSSRTYNGQCSAIYQRLIKWRNLPHLTNTKPPVTATTTCFFLLVPFHSGGLTMRQWRHELPAPDFWAKKSAPHSDSVQIFEVINLYNRTV